MNIGKNWKMVLAIIAGLSVNAEAHGETIRVAVTTSFYNSGLSEVLLPQIKADLDLDVQLLVVGTGQALKLGEQGDVDAILVHSRTAEDAFLVAGYGTHRREIMFNDFVFIGPIADPARISGVENAVEALNAIAMSEVRFISRGDDSGTHKIEKSLWVLAGLNPDELDSNWYNGVGAGMGAALNTASGMNAYIMSDRASWLNFQNKGDLALLYAGDPVLFNQYAYLPVNPVLHPHAKHDLVVQLEAWLVGDVAKELINSYMIEGETLFTFNAGEHIN